MAAPFALAAKLPGQRQPDLGLRRLHSRWLIGSASGLRTRDDVGDATG
jgi:hypothetical protein